MPFKCDLARMGIGVQIANLKKVAREYKVTGFKASNKQELTNLIWKKKGVSVTPDTPISTQTQTQPLNLFL